jgi:hypothetical protein
MNFKLKSYPSGPSGTPLLRFFQGKTGYGVLSSYWSAAIVVLTLAATEAGSGA